MKRLIRRIFGRRKQIITIKEPAVMGMEDGVLVKRYPINVDLRGGEGKVIAILLPIRQEPLVDREDTAR